MADSAIIVHCAARGGCRDRADFDGGRIPIAAVRFGGVFVYDSLIEAAGKITVPFEYQIPWEDKGFDRTSGRIDAATLPTQKSPN